ncbi:hypothetical protein NL676_009669 [Syzygium grande]|nr:hypothetical protein NL676_009669 [Syzygium grande]
MFRLDWVGSSGYSYSKLLLLSCIQALVPVFWRYGEDLCRPPPRHAAASSGYFRLIRRLAPVFFVGRVLLL